MIKDSYELKELLERLRKRQRKNQGYIYSQATQKSDKRNSINLDQHKFRPDVISTQYQTEVVGIQKCRNRFSSSDRFNEHDR